MPYGHKLAASLTLLIMEVLIMICRLYSDSEQMSQEFNATHFLALTAAERKIFHHEKWDMMKEVGLDHGLGAAY